MDAVGLIPSFGNVALNVVAFIVALSIIVAVHEYGHYIIGRLTGIHAEVFSIGFGKVLWSRMDKRGTRWQVAAIPLGGYVKFLGDANAASAGTDGEVVSKLSAEEMRHTMHGAPLWARAATVAAGPFFNFALTILLGAGLLLAMGIPKEQPAVAVLYALPGGVGGLLPGDEIVAVEGTAIADWKALNAAADSVPHEATLTYEVKRDGSVVAVDGPALYPPRISNVSPGTAAASAGLKPGDVIETINGTKINTFDEIGPRVREGAGAAMTLGVWREGQRLDITLTPKITDTPKEGGGFETRYLIGIGGDFFFGPATRAAGPWEAVQSAARQGWFVAKTSLSTLGHVVTGAISSCNVRGAITIAETSAHAVSLGPADFIWYIAALSTAIGLINLFPVPMLDGGHLVFYAFEALTGRPLPERVLNFAVSVGLVIVLGFMMFGLSNDLFCP
ncbi:RIP metalloprotease RseP [Frigidibacter sp. RF13]|uniref:RIP metalloprotease RseP n=1 Tax=Frigidibacter sp. RF13 TaxID=2997340 RepID=UPI00226E12F4|nr:RIP metalloprotease RseP [Frigidibacter sp. RF13]MCY1125388.1 RIP metalloprotease RseP [Frigidibacter sp. RF13]